MHGKIRVGLMMGLMMATGLATAANDDVAPARTNVINIREEAITSIGGSWYEGTTLLLTNCLAYSDTAGVTTQGLNGVTVNVKVGNTANSTSFNATVYADAAPANTNKWWASFVVPTNVSGTMSVQIKITDTSSNSYIYPWKILNHKEAL